MKRMIRRLFIFMLVCTVYSCSLFQSKIVNNESASVSSRAVTGQDNVPPSKLPPKTASGEVIPRSHTPLFVTYGWDDNAYADAMDWSVNMVAGKNNPAGSGQAATYDGTPLTFSYFHIGVNRNRTGAVDSWKRAYDAGHEIGNHTYSHNVNVGFTEQQWESEINQCNDVLTAAPSQGPGAPLNEIYGFRTPQLKYNDALFNVLSRKNMYDCTIEEGFEYDQDGTNNFWPYTLDNGSPGHDIFVEWKMKNPINPHPGVWEMPIYTVIVPPELRETINTRTSYFDVEGGKITGFDFNLWYEYKMTKAEYLATLKHTFDLKLKGNRAPFMFGTHTDMYSSSYGHAVTASLTQRREAMEEFIEYARSKSVVRIVSIKQVLDWMKNPVALQGLDTHTITASAGANGTIEPVGSTTVYDCDTVTFTIKADKGYMIDTVSAGVNPVEYGMGTVTVGPVEASSTLNVTFKALPSREPFQGTYYWTYNPADEPVDMTTPMVDMLDSNDNVIATVPEALAKRIAMEGSGFLPEPDGRLLNLSNSYDWPQSRFMVCDPDVAPWGYNATGDPLVPYKSLAVDPDVIPLGSDVYVEEFDGLRVPDPNGGYFIHDGWWVATDTSHSFSGYQIDFFVATYPNYIEINELLNNLSVFQVYCKDQIPGESVYITATTNRPGAIWPSGEIRVAVGKGEKFYFFPGGTNTIKEVLVGGVAKPYNTEDNTLIVNNVTSDTTVHLEIESQQVNIVTECINGTITPSFPVEPGEDVVIEFSPDQPDYILEYVKINGEIMANATSPLIIPGVVEDLLIQVMFRPDGYFTIETSKTGNGTIDPSQTVPGGSNVTINFEADPGHRVESVTVNGDVLDPTPEGSYDFNNITANQSIHVEFAPNPVKLTAEYTLGAVWNTGFGASVVVTNNSTDVVNGWKVTMTFSEDVRISGWNGNYSQDGRVVTVTNASWNGTVQPNGTVSFGMNGYYSGEFPDLVSIEVVEQ